MNSITLDLTKDELKLFIHGLETAVENATEKLEALNRNMAASNSNIAEARSKRQFFQTKLRAFRSLANGNRPSARASLEAGPLQFTKEELTRITDEFQELIQDAVIGTNNNNIRQREFNDTFYDLLQKLFISLGPTNAANTASVASSVNSNNGLNSPNYTAGPEGNARRRRNRRTTRKNRKSRKSRKASRRS